MLIALDAMGGDLAPQAIVEGAFLAKKEIIKDKGDIILIGQELSLIHI